MKKILCFIYTIAFATTAFTQIKGNKSIAKSYEPAKQNVAIMAALNTNTDSVAIQQLFEAYKTADADANAKLEKLIDKMKVVNEKNASKQDDKTKKQYDNTMSQLESIESKKAKMMDLMKTIMQSQNEEKRKLIERL